MARFRRSPFDCGLRAGLFFLGAFGAGFFYLMLAVQGSDDPGLALPVWFGRGDALLALALTAGGLFNLYRCRVAMRQERRLANPHRAASVPPLKRHVVTTRERGRRRREVVKGIGYLCGAMVLLLGGLVLHAAWLAVIAGLVCVLVLAATWSELTRWRRIRYVERRSNQQVQTARAPEPSAAPRLFMVGLDNTIVNVGLPSAGRFPQAQARPPLEVRLWQPGPSETFPSLLSGIRELTHERNFAGRPPLRIGYFRLFDNDPGVDPVWAKYGYVHLLRSPASVSREEAGRMKKSPDAEAVFVTSAAQLMLDIS